MRRILFTLIAAFALALGGGTNSAAAQNCPMQQAQSADMHDCGDNGSGAPIQDDDGGKMADCVVGMFCRTAVAITPAPSPNTPLYAAASTGHVELGQPAPPSGPLQDLFRPPRTLRL